MERMNKSLVPKQERNGNGAPIPEIDRFRAFIFPNNIRKHRKARGIESLLQLSQRITSTTYIRLSKVERGEIFARPDELRSIAEALDVDVEELLLDIDDPNFDIAAWAEDYLGPLGIDSAADDIAILLAAAMRVRRAEDDELTIALLERDYDIAPVILSRIENAYKPLDRWSRSIQESLLRLFDVADSDALVQFLQDRHASGEFAAYLPLIANPAERIAKTRAKLRKLRADLAAPKPLGRRRGERQLRRPELSTAAAASHAPAPAANFTAPQGIFTSMRRLIPVYGAPLPDGLIARLDTGEQIEAPRNAGPNAYGLRICRPTLGPGLPGRAIVIVDPDRYPSAGSLAVIQEEGGLRLLAVAADRQGRMMGFSEHPDFEVAFDALDPQNIATIISAQLE